MRYGFSSLNSLQHSFKKNRQLAEIISNKAIWNQIMWYGIQSNCNCWNCYRDTYKGFRTVTVHGITVHHVHTVENENIIFFQPFKVWWSYIFRPCCFSVVLCKCNASRLIISPLTLLLPQLHILSYSTNTHTHTHTHTHTVCVFTAVCVHLDGLNAEHEFQIWVTILGYVTLLN